MNEFFQKEFYGNTILEWVVSLSLILLFFIIGKIIYWLFKNILKKYSKKTKTDLDDIIVNLVEKPIVIFLMIFGFEFSLKTLTVSDKIVNGILKITRSMKIFVITWIIVKIVEILVEKYLTPIVNKTENDMDDHLLPVIKKGIKIMLWALAIIVALDNAGYDVGTIIAGLGIGGLAFALAAQDTISNLFGGITIFIDKPFKIGDRIKTGGYDGVVNEIGIRTSRIKTLEGRTVAIQNSHFLKSPVENVSSEPSRKVVMTLGLEYATTEENMKKAINILKKIVENSNNIEDNNVISFSGFGPSSLDILFIYYIKKDTSISDTKSEINFEILKQFNSEKLEFAFPSRTIYSK